MQSDLGKLFIGGISWDTNEERLKEYFSTYGKVLEIVIMKDRTTGRARGFGFIVFADPDVAESVTKEKHNIDGRVVEAKKAVPRDDQSTMSRNSSIQGSPGPGHTRKIFVGGLPSTVTESDFKNYFQQFGTITDVVVMYDHNTQRPRGFGFITYDSEDAVDKVLIKTFHELNGKMVEVKRAVPKELSPGPSRSMLGGYNYGFSSVNSFLNDYIQGYSPNSVGGYGVRMDGRLLAPSRSGYAPLNSGYGMGLNFEPGLRANYAGNINFNSTLSYGRGLNPYYMGNSNRVDNPMGFDGGNLSFSSTTRNMWDNGGFNYGTNSSSSSSFMGSQSAGIGGGTVGNSGINWGSFPNSPLGGRNASSQGRNFDYRGSDNNYGFGAARSGRNVASNIVPTSLYAASNGGYDRAFADFYGSGSVYGDSSWRSANSDQDGPGPFGYRASDIPPKSSSGFVGGYKRQQNIGIAG